MQSSSGRRRTDGGRETVVGNCTKTQLALCRTPHHRTPHHRTPHLCTPHLCTPHHRHLIIVHLTIVPVISTSTRRFCKLQVGTFCVSGNNLPSAAPHHLSHPILAAFHTDRNQCIGQISTTPEARMPDFEA